MTSCSCSNYLCDIDNSLCVKSLNTLTLFTLSTISQTGVYCLGRENNNKQVKNKVINRSSYCSTCPISSNFVLHVIDCSQSFGSYDSLLSISYE